VEKKLSSSDACTSKPYPVLAHLQFLLTPPSSRLTSVRMESSVSTTDSGGSNPLPLIVCDKCGKWWVVRRLSKLPGVMGNPSTVVPHTRLVLVLVSVFYLPQFCLSIQFSCFFCEAQWRRMSFFLPGERVHRAAARQQEASQRSLWHLRFEDEG